MDLATWTELPTDSYGRRDCPACGDSQTYPTSCRCDFERRVFALAALGDFPDWTRANVVKVNRAMRALDESWTWPVRDRAIRRARDFSRSGGCLDGLDSYVRMVDYEIGRIVNAY